MQFRYVNNFDRFLYYIGMIFLSILQMIYSSRMIVWKTWCLKRFQMQFGFVSASQKSAPWLYPRLRDGLLDWSIFIYWFSLWIFVCKGPVDSEIAHLMPTVLSSFFFFPLISLFCVLACMVASDLSWFGICRVGEGAVGYGARNLFFFYKKYLKVNSLCRWKPWDILPSNSLTFVVSFAGSIEAWK